MRRLAVALSTCMMLPSAAVHALGMGDIDVQSALNENLSAKIELLSVEPDDLGTLEVSLASKSIYEKMGIDRSAILSQLQFEVVSKGAGAPYVKVSSKSPIREPFLDFVLNASWASGQVLREYTLLLDPPVFEEVSEPAAVATAVAQPATIARSTTATPRAAAPRIAPPGSYGPTGRTDTLWTVATQMRPDTSVSVPQMMIALLKENPEAFTDGNINNLKAGYILRTPQMNVITALSKDAAANETNLQYQEWQAARSGTAAPVARRQRLAEPAVDAPMAAAPVDSSSFEEQARLQLLTPEEIQQRTGMGSALQGEGGGSVQQQLALAMETAEASKQENADLRARLAELEKQLQSVQRLISLKDDTLTAMQAGLGEQEQPAAETEETMAATTAPEEEKVVDAAKPEPKKVVKKPVPPAAPVETSLIDDLMADPKLLGMAVGGPLLLILLLVSYLRKRRQGAEEDFMVAPLVPQAGQDTAAATGTHASATAAAAEVTTEAESDDNVGFGDFVSTNVDSIHAEESEIDPIAEADVYLAYRRYEQAEALLKEAIRADANRGELKLKLLEIYFATKDKDSFEAQAEALYATLGGQEEELWSQAVEMGREICPDHPLFADGSGITASTSEALDPLSNDDLVADLGIEESQTEESVADTDLSDADLASSLGMSTGDAETSAETSGLDLDLNLGDELNLDLDANALAESFVAAEASTDLVDAGTEAAVKKATAAEENEFDLDHGEAETATAEVGDLTASLGDLEQDMDEFTASLEMTDDDDLQALTDLTEAEPLVDSADEIRDWEIEPAMSSFDSHDVRSNIKDAAVAEVDAADDDLSSDKSLDFMQLDDDAASVSEEDILAAGDGLGEELTSEEESGLFDSSEDAVATKLDLAKAYFDMGDHDGARAILDEVVKEGDDSQRQEAEQLKQQIS